jgi:formate dehydrogenase subunit delta
VNPHTLTKMANDIADFFRSEPDRSDAVQGIAGHIERFWEPRMRRQILEHAREPDNQLDDLVREALRHVKVPEAS